ncbi:MAG: hypothetical protein ACLQVN_08715, partial [Bryobacteraceae bacterium]
YARAYGFDVIALDQPIDTSERARRRSPAWQKCLILSHPKIADYEQVVWMDSDIVVNDKAPDVASGVDATCVGAVDCNTVDAERAFPILAASWGADGIDPIRGDFHAAYGLPANLPHVVQTGVLVLSPKHHRPVLESVYRDYEDKGGAEWCYEMRPLSYELQRQCCLHWLDPRFNRSWLEYVALNSPKTPPSCAPPAASWP